jgi:hypothetical protein
MLAAGEALLRARITGVVVLAYLVGASGAGAQTPSPDPAPVPAPPPPAPVVEPTPTPVPTTSEPSASEPEPKPKPRPKHKEQPAPSVQTTAHPTLAEDVPYFQSSRASAPKTSVVPAAAPLVATTGSRGSPAVLILVFLLGSASLVLVALKDVPTERLGAVPIILSEHRGEVAYISLALLLGAAIGLFATFALQ